MFRSDNLSRVHRERLVENGFLQEVMKEVFKANRQAMEQEVRRKYIAGDTEVDGSILIRSDDLPA